jgi:glycosyltransferase involved in cell wall biosynthesis
MSNAPIEANQCANTLLFVSPRFLFPVDSGGKIRTTQVMRGMKGGRFRIKLVSPGTSELAGRFKAELDEICDDFAWWPLHDGGRLKTLRRISYAVSRLPISVRSDWCRSAAELVKSSLEERPAAVVFDFVHSTILAPSSLTTPSVLFTHNVESEIFARHARVTRHPLLGMLWRSQANKMRAFESAALGNFDVVVAVSDRDADAFRGEHDRIRSVVIPTGVDPEFFRFHEPVSDNHIVFCGSMDWLANQEAMTFFMDDVWNKIVSKVPDARLTVIGRAPPESLIDRARRQRVNWTFTGYVDDVRPYLKGAGVSVIPMRVGGGTRLKVYEAMAAGTAIVSTSVGVEGLPIDQGTHYLNADEPDAFADAVVSLLSDRESRVTMARRARQLVEREFSYRAAASAFEQACSLAVECGRRPSNE